jgi:hypothetical protein
MYATLVVDNPMLTLFLRECRSVIAKTIRSLVKLGARLRFVKDRPRLYKFSAVKKRVLKTVWQFTIR